VSKKEKLVPPDPDRCQVEWTDYRPFTMGGPVHQTVRCDKVPSVIATENRAPHGSMSVCEEHLVVLREQKIPVSVKPIRRGS
jgi:hypothetical protein